MTPVLFQFCSGSPLQPTSGFLKGRSMVTFLVPRSSFRVSVLQYQCIDYRVVVSTTVSRTRVYARTHLYHCGAAWNIYKWLLFQWRSLLNYSSISITLYVRDCHCVVLDLGSYYNRCLHWFWYRNADEQWRYNIYLYTGTYDLFNKWVLFAE